MLVKQGALKPGERPAGYEVALDYNGLPFELVPLGIAQFKGPARFQLLSVNEAEYSKNPCRRYVTRRGSRWELANNGLNLLDLLAN
jgi:hypothetical protein